MQTKDEIEHWFVVYGKDIHKYLVYYTGQSDVDDLVQDVFIKAIKGINGYEGRSSPKTWLFTIARNLAINYQRKQRLLKWIPESILGHIPSREKKPEQWLDFNEDRKNLYLALSGLKRNYRDVLLLRVIQGLSVLETADILKWSESKVKVTLHRALKALEKKIVPSKEGDEDAAI